MKLKSFFFAICLLFSGITFAQGGACYIEFYGNSIMHRGVIIMDAQGRGQCRIAMQTSQGVATIDQQVQQIAMQQPQQPSYYHPSQSTQNQGFILACSAPTLTGTGQYAQGYSPDNFYFFPNGQVVNCDASGGRCAVNFRPIQSQQELQQILQSLGGGSSTPSYPTGGGTYPTSPQTPSNQPIAPSQPTKPGSGPKYPTKPGGGMGN